MGFDFGRKRIGVALASTITLAAKPLEVVRCDNGKPDWARIEQMIDQWAPDLFIVGRPLNMDGTSQSMTTDAQRFGRQLGGRFRKTVIEVDERLSTRAAWTDGIEHGYSTQEISDSIDAHAACIILESWLNTQQDTK